MVRLALLIIVAGFIWFTLKDAPGMTLASPDTLVAASPANAAPATPERIILAQAQTQPSAKARRTQRTRPQIWVTPRYPYRNYHSLYPVPYKYEYPGPNGVRECVNRYVTENRPSGPVIVQRTKCWWVVRR